MNLKIQQTNKLRGEITVPGDKSITHRALMLSALAEGTTRVYNWLPAQDCQATLRVLRALRIDIAHENETTLVITGRGLHGLQEPSDVLDCGGSGTTMRLLAGILAGQSFYSVLTGNAQLRRRPMARIIAPLREMGAQIWGRAGDKLPPLTIRGAQLRGADYTLPVASAQVKSALLLAGLFAAGKTIVREPGPARDHTERMLKAMGAAIQTEGPKVILQPDKSLKSLESIEVPGDISSAAFFLVAGAIAPDAELIIRNVGVNPTRTGVVDALHAMGAQVTLTNQREVSGELVADLTARSSELHGTVIGGELIPRAIDELPILAVAATQAKGITLIKDAAELRVKETDRIAATAVELRKMGAKIEERDDGLMIEGPTRLSDAEVASHRDHRLAMALAIAGLVAEGETVVGDVECIDDSFPGFAEVLGEIMSK